MKAGAREPGREGPSMKKYEDVRGLRAGISNLEGRPRLY